jgi:glycerophosphoryl diester phosphodiesterase
MTPIVVAHRGDPVAHRENTLESFAAAVDAGADMIELDVRRTADGRAVVAHDATLDRVWGVAGRIAEMTRDEVVSIGVCDLAQALESIPAHVQVMVDYKDEDVAEPALADVIAAGALDRSVFAGGCFTGHRRIRALAPEARIAATWESEERVPDALLDELAAEFYNPRGNVLAGDAGAIERMHARGTKVSVWTIDQPDAMEFFIASGVDAIITNRVALLVDLLGARC